jgi:hypothetical protein
MQYIKLNIKISNTELLILNSYVKGHFGSNLQKKGAKSLSSAQSS